MHKRGGARVALKCPVDNRKLLPRDHPIYGDMRALPQSQFLELEVGGSASAIFFGQKIRGYCKGDPFRAATAYAGCQSPNGPCAKKVLRKFKWWWVSGLDKAVIAMEEKLPEFATSR